MRYVAISTIRQMAVPGVAVEKTQNGNIVKAAVRPKYKTVKAGTLLELTEAAAAELGDNAVVPLDDIRAAKFGYGPKVAAEIAKPTQVKLGRDEVPNEDAVSDEKAGFEAKHNSQPAGVAPDSSAVNQENAGALKNKGVDVEAFGSHAAITEFMNEQGVVQPDGWEGMKLKEKKEALKAILDERGEPSTDLI